MNREDIIGIATESWLTEYGKTLLFRGDDIEINIEELERFAAFVAAAEREACAKRLDAVGCDHCAANIRARGNT